MATANTARRLVRRLRSRRSSAASRTGWHALTSALENKGDLKRWSIKNTAGGLIVTTACEQIVVHGITWPAIALCFVGILPLALSMFDR